MTMCKVLAHNITQGQLGCGRSSEITFKEPLPIFRALIKDELGFSQHPREPESQVSSHPIYHLFYS